MRKNIAIYILISIVMLYCTRVEALDWETDLEIASLTTKASGKYMLLDFSGSDWCGWCKKLEKEVFSQDAFKDFAKKNLVCVLGRFSTEEKTDQGIETAKQGFSNKVRDSRLPNYYYPQPGMANRSARPDTCTVEPRTMYNT